MWRGKSVLLFLFSYICGTISDYENGIGGIEHADNKIKKDKNTILLSIFMVMPH